MCPPAMFAHVNILSQHSNWNHYGTRLSRMVVWELLITWKMRTVLVF